MALRQEDFTSLCDDVDLDRDRALVERCQAGDSAAFGNLYARYYERLLRFCQRRLNDRHEAEDAAQEAFARAWKALPNFAGERRFYPWLTVIAGNICTDMLRRRSRSTPTDDVELGSHQPVGGGGSETSEELVLAAVDGELVNRALDRLSVRHQHVLAMREGSGWSYQQIADHEGVEIGTIETLLWRARQALKREFNVLSDSKGAFGGFLVGAGAFIRRGILRTSHRAAVVQQGGGSNVFRNAVAGVAVTSAAVAAAFIAPHAFSAGHTEKSAAPVSASVIEAADTADPTLPMTGIPATISAVGTIPSTVGGSNFSSGSGTRALAKPLTALAPTTTRHAPQFQTPATKNPSSSGTGTSPTLFAGSNVATTPVAAALGSVATALTNTGSGLANTLGLAQVLSNLGLVTAVPALSPDSSSDTTTVTPSTIPAVVSSVTSTVSSTVKALLGHS